MSLSVDHETAYVAPDTWEWAIRLTGTDAELDAVESVSYALDPTFPDPVRTSSARSDRFQISGHTASGFHYYATIESRGGAISVLDGEISVTRIGDPDRAPVSARRPHPRISPGVAGEADGVFEAVGARVLALAGALNAAEEAGIRRWVNVTGISAGAAVAALLAVGYTGRQVAEILREAPWAALRPKRTYLVTARQFSRAGYDDGKHLVEWLEECFATSPLGNRHPTFADVAVEYGGADPLRRHRLQILISDISVGQVRVLPHDLAGFEDEHGKTLDPADFPLSEAVRMSMALPVWFEPPVLYQDGRPHFIVDGGILSNFPVWMFDSPQPQRPTWGLKVYSAPRADRPGDRSPHIGLLELTNLVLNGVMDADIYNQSPGDVGRSLRIPSVVSAWRKMPDASECAELVRTGYESCVEFFADSRPYRNSFGASPAVEIDSEGVAPAM